MSVYTAVSPDELDAWLARYAFGALVDARMESCARVARMVEMRECFF